jgi:hypothetical protein
VGDRNDAKPKWYLLDESKGTPVLCNDGVTRNLVECDQKHVQEADRMSHRDRTEIYVNDGGRPRRYLYGVDSEEIHVILARLKPLTL